MRVIHIIEIRDGINQNWIGNSERTKIILIQFREVIDDVEGSKIEKIFIIMISFNKV